MVRSSEEYRSELLCVYTDIEFIKSCDPEDTMFSSDDSINHDTEMEECQHLAEDMNLDTDADWTQILDNQPIVLNDRMMTDAVQSPHIQSEHSYSLTLNDEMPQSPFGNNIKLEDYGKDMETECFPAVSMTSATGEPDFPENVLIKQEPASPPPATSPRAHSLSTISSLLNAPSPPLSSASSISSLHPQSLLKQPTIVLAARPSPLHSASSSSRDHQMMFPKVNVKVEPSLSTSGFPLPPTPPSCNGSDSDGSLSPVHGGSSHLPSSPPALLCSSPPSTSSTSTTQSTGHVGRKSHAKVVLPITSTTSKHSSNSQAALISSQPKGATGVLLLTDEEKRTLLAEGYPIPQRLPLTKAEERSLKKIRRKIKNKISAQESRRKKKEYMDALEKKVEILSSENNEYKKKLDSLEGSNKSLLSQLQHLQAILSDMPSKRSRNVGTQTFPSSSSSRQNDSSTSEMSTEVVEVIDAKGR
ncbi:cyclic AMP response element-binding protein A-like isoform X1 [Stegodyphus dumicola]|uniref:cyclic AMP response element-binding protein A-like isoform X1 n=1 Tax=Stegodyphus dumicola TaxID=202533 RepID=UPI0015AA88A3|nr:cyclic AMP response element-binding protein A-like isoform X1 [Stegodyphus dumicola]